MPHDLFTVPLDSIAATLGRTPNATKQLALRARGRVRAAEPAEVAQPDARSPRRSLTLSFAAAIDPARLARLVLFWVQ